MLTTDDIAEKTFSFQNTTATSKIFALKKRIRAVKGGTSASKTISILTWGIDYCQTSTPKNKIMTVVSESFPHLKLGAIRDFKAIMLDRGYWKDVNWNATNSFYTFETGHIMEFMSADTYGKAHGPRRDVLFLNECNNLTWEIVDQLIIRTREIVWLDWNPTAEFWFHIEMLPYRDDIDYITLTYLDNEALDEITKHEIESHKHNTAWWNVYGLGQDGQLENMVYPEWGVLDEIPPEARLARKGLDFGYANDPTALVDIYEWNKCLIFDEVLYQKGLVNSEIANKIGRNQPLTIGDSAEPKSIAEISQHGVTIIGAKKGKGSVSHGIDGVRSRKCFVTKRSVNIIKERRNYCYIKDAEGKITNEPIDILNHAMDAIRYGVADLIPDATEEDAYVPDVEYQTPGLGTTKEAQRIVPTITGPSKNRLAFLQDLKRAKADNDYETDTPYENPGLPY